MKFILVYWYLWVIGLIVCPLIAILGQLKNIQAAIADNGKNPATIGQLFMEPAPLILSIIGGMGMFICFVFFCASVIMAIIQQIKG